MIRVKFLYQRIPFARHMEIARCNDTPTSKG
jgi:hypothetical protein